MPGYLTKPADEADKSYVEGLLDGINMFAWMKDSVSYVGTIGMTQKQAIADIQKEYASVINPGEDQDGRENTPTPKTKRKSGEKETE